MNLNHRTIVITGATGGLGKVAARIFGERGARLALIGRSKDKLTAL